MPKLFVEDFVEKCTRWDFLPFQVADLNGGDDGTRTRGLCRDSSNSDAGENENE